MKEENDYEEEEYQDDEEQQSIQKKPIVVRPQPKAMERERDMLVKKPVREKWKFISQPEVAGYEKGDEFLSNIQAIEKILNMLEEINLKL